jgi:hypothetical protein
MWPFRKTKWVVIKQEVQPSLLEIMIKGGLTSIDRCSPAMGDRTVLIHYRDELSGNEKVEAIEL